MTESPDRSAEGEAILPDIGVLKPKLMQLARGSKLKFYNEGSRAQGRDKSG